MSIAVRMPARPRPREWVAMVGAPAGRWVAMTDVASEVPPTWRSGQVRHAGSGAHAVIGTVSADDWTGHPPGACLTQLGAFVEADVG